MPILIIIVNLLNDDGIIHLWNNSDAFEDEVSSEPKIKLPKLSFMKKKKK